MPNKGLGWNALLCQSTVLRSVESLHFLHSDVSTLKHEAESIFYRHGLPSRGFFKRVLRAGSRDR